MLVDAVEKIIREHVPDEQHPCWANERWCLGCNPDFSTFPYIGNSIHLFLHGGFARHQAELIRDYVRETIGACR